MKNLILVLLLLSGCTNKAPPNIPTATPTPTSYPATPTPSASSTPSTVGNVTLKPVDYYTTSEQRTKIISAGKKMNEVIHSQCFRDFMEKTPLIQTNGRTPKQVVDQLQALTGTIPIEMYNPGRFSSAVAYRQPPSLTIHLSYNYFYTSMSDCEWASTIAHESLGHSLGGYDHDYKWSASREYSVPYAINHAFEKNAFNGAKSGGCCK